MSRRARPQRRFLPMVTLVIVVGVVGFLALSGSSGSGVAGQGIVTIPRGTPVLTVGRTARGRPIPPGFVGLSLEYTAIEPYAGTDPNAVNPVLEQLIRNLAPGQAPVLRIGGDTTDWTWWPVPYLVKPPGVRYSLTDGWLQVTSALSHAVGARLIFGLNLEANSGALAAAQARALIAGVGRGTIAALEPGNEPELYGSFGWYRAPNGGQVPGRSRGYNFEAFMRDFSSLRAALPHVPLAGPATGAPKWMRHLDEFLSGEQGLGVVTLHRYPLQRCFVEPGAQLYPTIAHLLAAPASQGLAASVAPYAAIAHAHGLPLRIDEMNTVSCGGAAGVSDTFATALWDLDAMFQMAAVGVDGVNIHTYPAATYELFTFTHVGGSWRAFVKPEYYGLMMFSQAAPPGSRLLRHAGALGPGIKTWATRAPDGRIRVVLINDSSGARLVAVRAPAGVGGVATLERLRAPSVRATSGVTFGGQSFGSETTTGVPAGPARAISVSPIAGDYPVSVPPASATLLTLPG